MATEKDPVTGEELEVGDGKVTFDDKQQEHFNKTLQARLQRDREQIKKQHDQEVATLRAEFDQKLKDAKKTPEKKGGDGQGDDPAALKAQYEEILANERNKYKNLEQQFDGVKKDLGSAKEEVYLTRKDIAIRTAASKQNFFDLDDVKALTQRFVDFDNEANTWVVKENGVVKQNNELKPMTLEQYYELFASQRPHFVNGEVKGGAGSKEATGYKGPLVKSKADLKTAKEKSDFISKFGYQKWEELPLK